jgi:hypothetical protein
LQASVYGRKRVGRPNRLTAAEIRAPAYFAAAPANQTATSDFRHFCAEVPKSLHIGAYPRVSLIGPFLDAITKPLQTATFAVRGLRRPA